jgi:hypothetical protein
MNMLLTKIDNSHHFMTKKKIYQSSTCIGQLTVGQQWRKKD